MSAKDDPRAAKLLEMRAAKNGTGGAAADVDPPQAAPADPELAAIAGVMALLEGLDAPAARRTLSYVWTRLKLGPFTPGG